MDNDEQAIPEEFSESAPTAAGPPPAPFPTIASAKKATSFCHDYLSLPAGAPLLVVRSVRRTTSPGIRQAVRTPAPRTMNVMFFAIKPNDAEAFGDGGVSFPVERFATCEQNKVNVFEGPITIEVGEIMETTEVFFGEESIYGWLSKDPNEPLVVSWLDSRQTAARHLCRMAETIGYEFRSVGILSLRGFVGEAIGRRIKNLSDIAGIKSSTPETIEPAKKIVLDLHRLGIEDQFISQALKAIREREIEEFIGLINAPPR
jgi:hypothetical protein